MLDNLIANAPLALRLVGDEVQEKAKLASRAKAVSPRVIPGPRRTGAAMGGAKLQKQAFEFARNQRPIASAEGSETESDCSEYFQFPQLLIPSSPVLHSTAGRVETVVVTIRLIDPLYDALGGREPSPPIDSSDPRIFDSAFLLDAQAALEYEHTRHLRARAIRLRLSETNRITHIDVTSDPAFWTFELEGTSATEVESRLREDCEFEWQSWCHIEERVLDPSSILPPGARSPDSPMSSAGEGEGGEMVESLVGSDELMSLPSEISMSTIEGELSSDLYDSRHWMEPQ